MKRKGMRIVLFTLALALCISLMMPCCLLIARLLPGNLVLNLFLDSVVLIGGYILLGGLGTYLFSE